MEDNPYYALILLKNSSISLIPLRHHHGIKFTAIETGAALDAFFLDDLMRFFLGPDHRLPRAPEAAELAAGAFIL